MALAERSPPRILAGQPHGMTFEQQRTERQGFGGGPVDLVIGVELPPRVELLGQLGVRREASGYLVS